MIALFNLSLKFLPNLGHQVVPTLNFWTSVFAVSRAVSFRLNDYNFLLDPSTTSTKLYSWFHLICIFDPPICLLNLSLNSVKQKIKISLNVLDGIRTLVSSVAKAFQRPFLHWANPRGFILFMLPSRYELRLRWYFWGNWIPVQAKRLFCPHWWHRKETQNILVDDSVTSWAIFWKALLLIFWHTFGQLLE